MSTRLVPYETLTATQRQLLETLEVHPEQQAFCGDIHSALHSLPSKAHPGIKGFVLLARELPVAFLLLKRHPLLAHWAEAGSATLHALQVDKHAQGQGHGQACLQALPHATRQVWPEISALMLSVDKENQAAMGLYLKQGWVDTGEAYRSRSGYERRLRLAL